MVAVVSRTQDNQNNKIPVTKEDDKDKKNTQQASHSKVVLTKKTTPEQMGGGVSLMQTTGASPKKVSPFHTTNSDAGGGGKGVAKVDGKTQPTPVSSGNLSVKQGKTEAERISGEVTGGAKPGSTFVSLKSSTPDDKDAPKTEIKSEKLEVKAGTTGVSSDKQSVEQSKAEAERISGEVTGGSKPGSTFVSLKSSTPDGEDTPKTDTKSEKLEIEAGTTGVGADKQTIQQSKTEAERISGEVTGGAKPGSTFVSLKSSTPASKDMPMSDSTLQDLKTTGPDDLVASTDVKPVSLAQTTDQPQDWNPTADLASKIFNSPLMNDVNKSLYQALNNADKSFESIDVLKNPGAYDDKQRMIAYLDTLSAVGSYDKFVEGLSDQDRTTNNSQEVRNDLQRALAIYEKDAGAQTKLTENIFKRIQGAFDGAAIGYEYDDSKSPIENMNEQGELGNRINALKDDLLKSYQTDIVEGGILKAGREAGQDYKTIFQQYNTTLGVYNSVLPESITSENLDAVNKSYSKFFTEDFLENLPDTKEALDGLITAGLGSAHPGGDAGNMKQDIMSGISKIIEQPLNALTDTYFKDDATASATYKTNMTTLATAAWQLAKPGGSFETLKNDLSSYIDKNFTAPSGTTQKSYKEAMLSGITGILQGSRAIYAGTNMTNPSWDSIGTVLLHSMAGTSEFLKAAGSTVQNSSRFLGDLAGIHDPEFLAAEKKATASALKGAGKMIGNIAAVGWVPVDYYQMFQGIKSGSLDTTGTILSAFGTAADTVGGIEGVAGLSQALINSSYIRGSGAALRFLPAAFSTAFTAAGVVSWAAWSGLTIYNSVRQWKDWKDQLNATNEQLTRTVNDTVSLAGKPGTSADPRNRVPVPEAQETVTTPEDWDAIDKINADWRAQQGWDV